MKKTKHQNPILLDGVEEVIEDFLPQDINELSLSEYSKSLEFDRAYTDTDNIEIIHKSLRVLRSNELQIVTWYFVYGYSVCEMGELMGASKQYAHELLQRSLKKLRRHMRKELQIYEI